MKISLIKEIEFNHNEHRLNQCTEKSKVLGGPSFISRVVLPHTLSHFGGGAFSTFLLFGGATWPPHSSGAAGFPPPFVLLSLFLAAGVAVSPLHVLLFLGAAFPPPSLDWCFLSPSPSCGLCCRSPLLLWAGVICVASFRVGH